MNTDLASALDALAHQVIADVLDPEDIAERWETYADIGQYDWEAICERVQQIRRSLIPADFQTAYESLAARAEADA